MHEIRTALQKSPSIYLLYKYAKVCAKLGADSANALSCMETACKFEKIFPNATFWAGVLARDPIK